MSMVQIYPQLTESANFNNWNFRVKTLLEEKGVADVLEEGAESRENFTENDAKARSIIVHCLSDKFLEVVKKAKNAQEMIKSLKDTLERKSVFNKLYLKRKLLSLKSNPKDGLQDHFLKFDSIINEASGSEMDETDKVCHLLLTLSEEYDQVITALEMLATENDKLNMDFVKSRLLYAEIKIKEKNKTENHTESSFTGHSSGTFPFNCYQCGRKGHKASNCKNRTDFSQGRYNHRRGSNTNRRGRSQANLADVENPISEISFVAFSRAFSAEGNGDNQNEVIFVIDSGATENLVREDLMNFMFDVTKGGFMQAK